MIKALCGYTYFDNDKLAVKALEAMMNQGVLGFDTETTGLRPESIEQRLRLVQFHYNGHSYLFDIWRIGKKAKHLIKEILESEIIKIAHNAKFDIKFVRADLDVKRFGTIFDTMIAELILACGAVRGQGFSLQDVVLKYCEILLDKEQRLSDWSRAKLTDEQLIYAANDVVYLEDVRIKQREALNQLGAIKCAKLEFDVIESVATMELNGIPFDEDSWVKVYEDNVEERFNVSEKLYDILAPDEPTLFRGTQRFNLNSYQQIIWRMEKLNIKVPTWESSEDKTESLKKTLSKTKLKACESEHPVMPLLLEYSQLKKAITSYGLNYLEKINPTTLRIHAEYNQIGALTSRFSCHNPNLQQPPKEDKYRNCFISDDGWSLVWGDYSQIELRILAEFCKDEQFQTAFRKGFDFHQYTASLIFDVEYEDVTDKQRNIAKNLNFGIVYGIGAKHFGETVGISTEKAQEIIDSYYRNYPKLRIWLDQAARLARYKRVSYTICGRTIKYNFNPSDKGQVGLVERNGKNTPIQGTSCDILKRALKLLHDEITERKDIQLVHIVHDEIILHVKDDSIDDASEILHRTMMQAATEYIKTVPIKVDTKKGKLWKK